MCDYIDAPPCDFLDFHTTYEDDDPAILQRPTTPLPDSTRTLRRTISCASIDTIQPPKKGVRRRIKDIAENLNNKSAKKMKRDPPTKDIPKKAIHGRGSDSKTKEGRKEKNRGRRVITPFQDLSQRSEDQDVLSATDRLHTDVPSEPDTPSSYLGSESDVLVDELLPEEDGQSWEDIFFPKWSLEPGAQVTTDGQNTFQPPRTTNVDIKDIQFDIRPSESDVTIWDGLQAAHYLLKCRLLLRCTMHPYDSVALPEIRLFEMHCNTHPVSGSHYSRPPVLQTTYEGASPGCREMSSGLPNVKPEAGIHIDQFWRTTLEDDGTWGWYRDAYVPISPRLFDKMEYRKFKLVGRVWLGEKCMESESTFGISMLLREVEMN